MINKNPKRNLFRYFQKYLFICFKCFKNGKI